MMGIGMFEIRRSQWRGTNEQEMVERMVDDARSNPRVRGDSIILTRVARPSNPPTHLLSRSSTSTPTTTFSIRVTPLWFVIYL